MKKLLLTTALMLAATPAFAQGHKLAASEAIQATGHVVSVDADSHLIKLKHDPIKALGWPTMTMNFTAENSVDLASLKEGDAVSFTLKPHGKEDYTISGIHKNASAGAQ